MVSSIISFLLILAGIVLLGLEVIFSLSIFRFSGAVGFGVVVVGVWITSFKVSRQKLKIRKKDLDKFPGGTASGGGDGC